MKQVTTFHGLLNEEEFLIVMSKSRKYTHKHLTKYVVEAYLGVAERFVSNIYIGRLSINENIKQELKIIRYFIKGLLPADYSLAYKKISINLGINKILKDKNNDDNILLRNVLTTIKPNLSWIERKENES